jgi:hypothetical protein
LLTRVESVDACIEEEERKKAEDKERKKAAANAKKGNSGARALLTGLLVSDTTC